MTSKVMTAYEAAQLFLARQQRQEHPDGKFDSAGRWNPSREERCKCCANIRTPSRRWPYSRMKHCRSLRHVANLTGIAESEIRRYAKLFRELGIAPEGEKGNAGFIDLVLEERP